MLSTASLTRNMTTPVHAIPIDQLRLYADIYAERKFQIEKWGPQHRNLGFGLKTYKTRADKAKAKCDAAEKDSKSLNVDDKAPWSHILEEEFWEALAEAAPDYAAMRKELIQVAAVAVAIIEDIEENYAPQLSDRSFII